MSYSAFRYNYAIVCRVPNSFSDRGIKDEGRQIAIEEARTQHRQLVDTLRKCEVNIIELQEDEDYRDCCCVEDCAIIIGAVALIARPGLKSRQGETKEIRRVLKNDMKLRIAEITNPDALLDGGDVLFTGKEILVGVGHNTNEKGANAVAEAFPEYFVIPIYMDKVQALHLKSVCSMAGKSVIAMSTSKDGEEILKQIRERAQFSYEVLKLETDAAANMLYINGRLVHRTREEINDNSMSVLDEKILYPKHQVCVTELEKARAALSSLVLLIQKEKRPRKIVSNLVDEDMEKYATIKTMK